MEKGKVDIGLIRRYINGELSPREMYALERRAQDDSALMDVILGMEREAQDVHAANLVDIRKRIAVRAGQGRTRRLAPAQRWMVAASVLVAVTLGMLWFTQRLTVEESQPEIASIQAEAHRSEQPARSGTSDGEDPADDTAAQPSRQPVASAGKKIVSETSKRVATAPAAILPPADRVAMQTEKKAKPEDTLDEVVVVGYGTQKKMDLTGAIDTTVQINEQALAGRVAGIEVRGANRKAAADTPAPIRIRGVSPNAKPDTIKGKVVDSETQQPLRGVSVQLAENRWVTTDSSGQFTIAGPSSMLNASLVGYELQTIKIVEKDSIILVMGPALASLNEVVVVGYGNKNSRDGQPEPLTGWRKYKRYLKKGVRQTEGRLKGAVTLTFTINDEGTPTDIRITHTTDPALSEKVAELVREGTKWKPGKNGGRKAEIQIEF